MTRLFMVKDEDGEPHLVAAVIDLDVWTYVANTGKFHRNETARHDYYFLHELEYVEITIAEAQRLMAAGVGTFDEAEDPEIVQEWRDDRTAVDPEVVFASKVADLA
ncbi:hypothetical protein [Kribbella italica]|uniref:Uncharacterized protein n=1 Tax=Kribbella italica TaxID=1540520 RepID=A0A7W9J8C5_9ACTN|nr:hypothetical protein [Kribbella italica]MBB5837275.1 hypothetical protein [Kribbella italica]